MTDVLLWNVVVSLLAIACALGATGWYTGTAPETARGWRRRVYYVVAALGILGWTYLFWRITRTL